jgi:rhodanese-related sulfurtransferase
MMIQSPDIQRTGRRDEPQRQPAPVPGEPGLFVVDATWGTIQPLRLAGVETVGELEVLDHLRGGGLVVDTRQPDQAATGTIPGAVAIRHQEIAQRLGGPVGHGVVVLYCNGPQCAATPQAVDALLAAGWPPAQLRYYRGGIHDWVTLGLPLSH